MEPIDVIIIVALGLAVLGIIVWIAVSKRKGKNIGCDCGSACSSCSGSCAGCNGKCPSALNRAEEGGEKTFGEMAKEKNE